MLSDLFVAVEKEQPEPDEHHWYYKQATVADLVSALPEDAETIDLVVDWLWGKVANKKVKRIRKALDALAEAQPFPPAGVADRPILDSITGVDPSEYSLEINAERLLVTPDDDNPPAGGVS